MARKKIEIYEEYARRGGTKSIKSFDSTADLIAAMDKLPPLPETPPADEEVVDVPKPKKKPVPKNDFVLDDDEEAVDVPAKPKKQPKTKTPRDPSKKRNPNTQARVNKLVAHSKEKYRVEPSFNRETRQWEFRSGKRMVGQCDSRKLAEFTTDFDVYDKWIRARVKEVV